MPQIVQLRNGTKSQWDAVASTVVLSSGEVGLETDTNKFKVGDGTSVWSALTYWSSGSSASDIPTFIQSTAPVTSATKYQWWDTTGGDLTLWIEDGT